MKQILREARIVLVCGKGGVGKTTLSAAAALQVARTGRRTLVCTIDPARRLANALGISKLADAPRRLPAAALRKAKLPETLELYASMLDTKRVFDEVIQRHAGGPDAAQRILDNPFYQLVSNYLTGSQEYMAVERLHQLHDEGKYECIVLDTPPSRHALDFLEAPRRITEFLESGFLGWILRPTAETGIGFLRGAGRKLISVVTKLLGSDLVHQVSDFFRAFEHMAPGFDERAKQVRELLQSDATAFLAVTTPTPRALAETRILVRRLHESGFPVRGVVFNRVACDWEAAPPRGRSREKPTPLPAELRPLLTTNFQQLQALARRDRAEIEATLAELPPNLVRVLIPDHAVEVRTLAGLARLGRQLCAVGKA